MARATVIAQVERVDLRMPSPSLRPPSVQPRPDRWTLPAESDTTDRAVESQSPGSPIASRVDPRCPAVSRAVARTSVDVSLARGD